MRPLVLLFLLWFALPARAEAPEPTSTQPPQAPSATGEPAQTDHTSRARSSLAWWWKHSTPVPIVFYTPENQLGIGAGVMTTWQMPGAYADRPSNTIVYGVYTTRRQTVLGASYELRFRDDRYALIQELRFIDWPDRYYGIGNDTKSKDREDFTDHYLQVETEGFFRAHSCLYVGLRHQFRVSETRDVDPASRLSLERPRGVGKVFWSGTGPVLLWDSRQGLFWPTAGSFLRADATFFRRALGAEFSSELIRLDLRHYQPLKWSHVLALRFVGFGATGSLPFQLYPSLGGANLFRGWFLGRLRDRVLLATEVEYRVPISKRWSAVGFGSAGRVAPRVSELTLDGLRFTGGAGARFAVRPASRANFRLDVAYGDELYVYFQFREAF